MIDAQIGKIHYFNATKNGNKIGIELGPRGKVMHFTTDEEFSIGEEVVVSVVRASLEHTWEVNGEVTDAAP